MEIRECNRTIFLKIKPNFNFIQNPETHSVCPFLEMKMISNKILQDCNSLLECVSIIFLSNPSHV